MVGPSGTNSTDADLLREHAAKPCSHINRIRREYETVVHGKCALVSASIAHSRQAYGTFGARKMVV